MFDKVTIACAILGVGLLLAGSWNAPCSLPIGEMGLYREQPLSAMPALTPTLMPALPSGQISPTQPASVLLVLISLLTISVIANAYLVFIMLTRRTSETKRPEPVGSVLAPFLKRLVSDGDALGNLEKFLYWCKQGKATAGDAFVVITILFETLERTWGVKKIGEIYGEVIFDPDQHYLFPGESLPRGERAQVVELGWQMGDQIIKYPTVRRLAERHEQ